MSATKDPPSVQLVIANTSSDSIERGYDYRD
jgi:hypothetical protein